MKKFLTIGIFIALIFGTGTLAYFLISKRTIAQDKEILALSSTRALDYSVRVPIMVYHGIRQVRANDSDYTKSFNTEPQIFEKQMQYIKDSGYSVISFNDLYEALTSDKVLPEKSVILSFDDGSQNQYDNAFPILKKFNYTATFFIFSSAPEHKYFMTWDEIRALDAAGMTIASHTLNHPFLEKITDPKELDKQIIYGKTSLEKHLGKTVDFFAYPFGEYNNETINVVKSAGFKMARSIHNGRYHTPGDLYTVKGIIMNSNYDRFVKELEKISK